MDEAVTTEDQKDEESKKSTHLVSMSHADVVHCTCSSTCNVDKGFCGTLDFGHIQHIDSAQVFLQKKFKSSVVYQKCAFVIPLFVEIVVLIKYFLLLYAQHKLILLETIGCCLVYVPMSTCHPYC